MCGVPVHAADGYLQRLIRLGHRVAVCEQMEDPARGQKARLEIGGAARRRPAGHARHAHRGYRSSTRGSHNYLAAVARMKGDGDLALAWADISSGDLAVMTSGADRLAADLARLDARRDHRAPTRSLPTRHLDGLAAGAGARSRRCPASRFDSPRCRTPAEGTFRRCGARWLWQFLAGRDRGAGRAARLYPADPSRPRCRTSGRRGAKSRRAYADRSGDARQSRTDPHACPATNAAACLSRHRLHGDGGGRALSRRAARQSAGRSRADQRTPRRRRAFLRRCATCARTCGQRCAACPISSGRSAGSRSGAAARAIWPPSATALQAAVQIAALLSLDARHRRACRPASPRYRRPFAEPTRSDLAANLTRALADDLPLARARWRFVRAGYSPDLDENRALARRNPPGDRRAASTLCGTDRHQVAQDPAQQCPRLFHRGTRRRAASVLQIAEHAATFIHRQTVADAMRFTTTELASLEQRIAAAADRALADRTGNFRRSVVAVCSDSAKSSRGLPAARRSARCRERRSPNLPSGGAMCGPGSTIRAHFRHQGRPPSGGGSGARDTGHRLLRRQ